MGVYGFRGFGLKAVASVVRWLKVTGFYVELTVGARAVQVSWSGGWG